MSTSRKTKAALVMDEAEADIAQQFPSGIVNRRELMKYLRDWATSPYRWDCAWLASRRLVKAGKLQVVGK